MSLHGRQSALFCESTNQRQIEQKTAVYMFTTVFHVRECVVTTRRQGAMRRQGMCRHNASSGGNASSGDVSSQCVVSVSAKCHTQAAGALYILYT